MSDPTIVGSSDPQEQQDSGKNTIDASGSSSVYIFKSSTVDEMNAFLSGYAIGDVYGPNSELIEKFETVPGAGGSCMGYIYTGLRNAIGELEWTDLEKALALSPYYVDGDGSFSGTDLATYQQNLATILNMATTNPSNGNPVAVDNPSGSLGFYNDYWNALARGENTYVLQAPTYRNTSYSATPPNFASEVPGTLDPDLTSSLMTSSSLADLYADSSIPSGWVWRIKALRITRNGPNGIYQIVAEWEGAQNWDPNIYGDPA